MKKLILLAAILLIGALLTIAGCRTSRAAYESAPYQVVKSDGKFEIRDYPALTIVETTMSADGNGADGSFGRLFRFITGGNESQKKYAMTTPVFMAADEGKRTMAFVLPSNAKASNVPRPSDGSVIVREIPAGRFAVLRFGGDRNLSKESQTLAELKDWMSARGLAVLSTPIYGYFDPPWTPSFLRRNEVMLRTESPMR